MKKGKETYKKPVAGRDELVVLLERKPSKALNEMILISTISTQAGYKRHHNKIGDFKKQLSIAHQPVSLPCIAGFPGPCFPRNHGNISAD